MARPEQTAASTRSAVLRTVRVVGTCLGVAVVGGAIGLVVAIRTPAHVEVAGSDTRLWLEIGRTYDELSVGGVIAGKRAATRTFLGEPVGVRAVIDLDTDGLIDPSGDFNTDVLPAYVQAYSDPEQAVEDGRRAFIGHLWRYTAAGAVLGLAVCGLVLGYRRWRARYDRAHDPEGQVRAAALGYRVVERRVARRSAAALVGLVVLGTLPADLPRRPEPTVLRADPVLAGTSLAGTEIDGLLQPAVVAIQRYIETYFDETDTYFDQLRTALVDELNYNTTPLPGTDDANIAQIGFVADRHCNIGMDRIIVSLLSHYDVTTLVSAGDDAFSGSFSFESACTRNLADKTRQAGITDVFAGGNHDSPMTVQAQQQEGIKTLVGRPVTVGGLTFVGSPDPRTSRYGQGIVPATESAQKALVDAQGAAVGKAACRLPGPAIVVLHDPSAGRTAVQNGCGKITLALDGHTHDQDGPNLLPLPDGGSGYQFTSASSGGAPVGGHADSLSARVTVGPLNHDATVNIVSVDKSTGALVGITEYTFTPDQLITVAQQIMP